MAELFAYKILTREQFAALRADGIFAGAPVDLADGYIHMSTRAQAAETAAKHFAGQDDLVLAMVDLSSLGDGVKWEESRGGQLFPHLYGDLPLAAVTTHARLRIGPDGKHEFPAGF
ncbi:DUF952 domain-containing protein [Sphingobium phenoxybenzoativorans]|uniref:DUF952 domain-containing protein n=1 Tax=Sphingobium phenoxybenzoativorans TaxID=1592790 RepID=UPI0008728F9E|nr:DUF952 domain-containing protein [Sphingobium phenoxybenzoativorans]